MIGEPRNLTDGDVRAVAQETARILRHELITNFYSNFGRGLWGLVWRGIIYLALTIAAYGAVHHNFP